MTAQFLMVQGTSSHVGKSRLVEALCRIFADRGVRVAPFKAQNMALNSAVTPDGREIGRSTAQQAFAARIAPRVEMNPLLLKPKSDHMAQLVVMGKPIGDFSAKDNFKAAAWLADFKRRVVRRALKKLARDFELIVIEGAGSPAEVNLRAFDIVNMDVAVFTRAEVLLVADIDKGGSLASLVGTMELLAPEERALVKGFVLNKFRGDRSLLTPALSFLRRKTGVPVLGVIPFDPGLRDLAEEDALPDHMTGRRSADALVADDPDAEIDIAVVYHPHLANFTDFNALAAEPRTRMRYVSSPRTLGDPDAVILPGTKNTSEDLRRLKQSGFADAIRSRAEKGVPVIGICGGYQMLGARLLDPQNLESRHKKVEGLGLLDVETVFNSLKCVRRVQAVPAGNAPFLQKPRQRIQGYEIHHGLTRRGKGTGPAFCLSVNGRNGIGDGAVSGNGLVFGTYLHDLFSNDRFRRDFVNVLRRRKGSADLKEPLVNFRNRTDKLVSRWAGLVERNLDLSDIIGSHHV